MDLPLIINTITSINEYKFKEKGSQFLALSAPADTEEKALEILNGTRKKYYDATHNCFAYSLADGCIKYSDDGEPNGTAGLRILNAINHFELVDTIVIVTRYFGGIKLGIGPLGKAYYESALQCLGISDKISKKLYRRVIINFPYEFSKLVHNSLTKYISKIETTSYEDGPSIKALIPFEKYDIFDSEILSISNLKVKISDTGERAYI